MKKDHIKALLLATFLSSVFSTQANAAPTLSANASATVVAAMSISESTAMQFGYFSSAGSAGTITQAGAVTGGVTAVASGVTRSGGIFEVSGTGNASYTLTLPATTSLTRSGGSETMDVTLTFASGTSARSLTSGTENVTINGSLTVSASQLAGSYTGTYLMSVAYN